MPYPRTHRAFWLREPSLVGWTRGTGETWQEQALCALPEHRDLLWFPDEEDRTHYRQKGRNEVKEVCGRCPVIDECRQYAESIQVSAGVWGGKQYYFDYTPGKRDT